MKLFRLLPLALASMAAWAQTPPPVTIIDDGLPRLENISVRHSIPAGERLIAGFVVAKGSGATVLVRGVGPSLASLGVSDAMPNPRLQIVDSQGRVVVENDDWINSPSQSQLSVAHATQLAGAFPLSNNAGRDAAAVVTLPPGAYSMVIFGSSATDAGVVLGEVYYLPHVTNEMLPALAENGGVLSRLRNLSVRCRVTPASRTIAGFVVRGGVVPISGIVEPRKFLIRAVGSTLSGFGVSDALPDAYLTLVDSRGIVIKLNENWDSDPTEAAAIRAAAAACGAFPLQPGSRDAAAIVEIGYGSFTVLADRPPVLVVSPTTIGSVSPGDNPPPAQPVDAIPSAGTVLIEIYAL